ncbi:hypothetical protein LguiA_013310 [Lonicera macranthoides]
MHAQVLMEVDFSKDLRYELTIERTRVCSKIEVLYKDLPNHCSLCHLIDHMLSEYQETRRQTKSIIPPEK